MEDTDFMIPYVEFILLFSEVKTETVLWLSHTTTVFNGPGRINSKVKCYMIIHNEDSVLRTVLD
jgi:hypothetical protein